MWVRDNKVWYEGELIEKIKEICSDELIQKFDIPEVTKKILTLIQENEK